MPILIHKAGATTFLNSNDVFELHAADIDNLASEVKTQLW